MPKKDLNQLAAFIVDQATNEVPRPQETARQKAGRLGGLKGGLARDAKLTSEEKKVVAKKASSFRWKKIKAD
jgi:hypothetical protein